MGPRGRITHVIGYIVYILHILDCLGQDMQVLNLGRAPRTKETLLDFLKWRRVTRPPLVFRGLTGSQRTPGFWGVTMFLAATKKVAMDGGIFWPQLKGWLWMGLFSSRN